MILIKSQVIGFVWIIGILAILVMSLLVLIYLKKNRNGGDDDRDE
jgi:hypothetical protein